MAEEVWTTLQRDWTGFCISEDLVLSGIRYITWVCNSKISDHMLAILHLEQEIGKVCYPFNFNSVWVEEPKFVNLVRENWNGLLGNEILNPMDDLVKKINILKSMVIN